MAATLHIGDHLREHWEALKRGRPGFRFRERYESTHAARHRGGLGLRIVMLVAAILCLAVAVVLTVIPGPAIPFYFLAGGLLATESRNIARLMDWNEVQARRLAAWAKWQWRRLPWAMRILVILVGVSLSAGMAYLSYRFFVA